MQKLPKMPNKLYNNVFHNLYHLLQVKLAKNVKQKKERQ